jgi:hypothetical protein
VFRTGHGDALNKELAVQASDPTDDAMKHWSWLQNIYFNTPVSTLYLSKQIN